MEHTRASYPVGIECDTLEIEFMFHIHTTEVNFILKRF